MIRLYIIISCAFFLGCCKSEFSENKFDPNLIWIDDLGKPATPSDIPGVINDSLTWVNIDSAFYILNTNTGKVIRRIPSGENYILAGARNMILEGDNLYINIAQWIRCYSFSTGNLIWDISLKENENESMILTEMKSYEDYLLVPKKGGAYIVDKLKGEISEEIELLNYLGVNIEERNILVRDVIPVNESSLIFATEHQENQGGGVVISIDIDSKTTNWEFKSEIDSVGNHVPYFPTISKMDIIQEKLVFIRGGHIHCLNANSGNEIWHKEYEDYGFFFGLDINEHHEVIVIGTTSPPGIIIGLNLKGNEVWQHHSRLATIYSIKSYDKQVYIVGERFTILDPKTGIAEFFFEGIEGDAFYTPTIISDSTFIGISTRNIYAWRY